MKYKLFTGLVLLIPVLIFVQNNIDEVQVHFLEWQWPVPLSLLVLGALLVGVIIGLLLSYFQGVKKKRRVKKAEQEQLKKQEAAATAAAEAAAAQQAAASVTAVNPSEAPAADEGDRLP